MNKLILILIGLLFIFPLTIATTSLSEATSCCEKTLSGASCINTPDENCNSAFASAPTSCESTSYCQTGTCYNPLEGNCIQSTPKSTCELGGGVWDERDITQVPQCQLGCCVVSDQAAFVSKTRCSRLAGFVGVTGDYYPDVESEFMCVLFAQSSTMGACVYEDGTDVTCSFQTRGDCEGEESFLGINNTADSSTKKFYADVLCSNEALGTSCEKQYLTGCSEGRVYWYDSCGNQENVYSSNSDKSNNDGEVAEEDEVCNPVAGSKGCGNCDYLMGGICTEKENSFGEIGVNHFCQATSCKDRNGNSRKNGESWCVYDGKIGSGTDPVGSRHYREVCLNGEIITSGCEDFRNEVCIHDSLDNGYDVASCRVNRWQSCVSTAKKSDCLNKDVRDCVWYSSVSGIDFTDATQYSSQNSQYTNSFTGGVIVGSGTGTKEYDVDLKVIDTTEDLDETDDGLCVPEFPPGLNFWNSGSASTQCAMASANCTVTYKEELDWDFQTKPEEITDGSECLTDAWAEEANQICVAMGDCGGYINYKGKYTQDGYEWFNVDGTELRIGPNSINRINPQSTGNMVLAVGYAIFDFVSGGNAEDTADAAKAVENSFNIFQDGKKSMLSMLTEDFLRTKNAKKYSQLSKFLKEAEKTISRNEELISQRERLINLDLLDDVEFQDSQDSLGDYVAHSETVKDFTFKSDSELYGDFKIKEQGTYLEVIGEYNRIIDVYESLPGRDPKNVARIELLNQRKADLNAELGKKVQDALEKSKIGEVDERVYHDETTNKLKKENKDLETKESQASSELNSIDYGNWERGLNSFGGVLEAAVKGIAFANAASQISTALGGSDRYEDSIYNAAYYGYLTYKSSQAIFGETGVLGKGGLFGGVSKGWADGISGVSAVGMAYYQYIDSYEDTWTKDVTFTCQPWQAPTNQNDCELCNEDDLPCSEYRCKSLGPSCGVVNEGTANELCIDMGINDGKPPLIKPNTEVLTEGFIYSSVTDKGFLIQGDGGNCIPPFTAIQWGITADEPAQCKIETRHTASFDEMRFYLGSSNIYDLVHEERLLVPDARTLQNSSESGIEIQNGNEMELYIRCRDGNDNMNSGEGNAQDAEYTIRFCVDDVPDKTPPQIVSSTITDGSCVGANTDSAPVTFYLNEPATCRWDKIDRDYNDLQYSMSCSKRSKKENSLMVYPCLTDLSGINAEETRFYMRCQDEAGNENDASYTLDLKGSLPMKMTKIGPNETIRSGSSPAEVSLYAETMFGCGSAICFYSETGADNDFIMFKDTANEDEVHTQKLYLEDGEKTIYFRCVDAGGNVAENTTSFDVEIDTVPPAVIRAYEEGNLLKIITERDATCAYSTNNCDFLVAEGEKMISTTGSNNIHRTEWSEEETYYIKCKDEFNNEALGCSIIVKPMDNFL